MVRQYYNFIILFFFHGCFELNSICMKFRLPCFDIPPIFVSADKPKPKENKEVNFIRQNVLRCSYRSRLPKKGENKNE